MQGLRRRSRRRRMTGAGSPRETSQYITGVAIRDSRVEEISPPMMAMARGE